MFLSDLIMTDSCKYFSTEILARRTSLVPSITDINPALFTLDRLKNQQPPIAYVVPCFSNAKERDPKMVILRELHDEMLSTSLDIAGREGKTIFSIKHNKYVPR